MWPGVIILQNEFVIDCYSVKYNNIYDYLTPILQNRQLCILGNVQVCTDVEKHIRKDHHFPSPNRTLSQGNAELFHVPGSLLDENTTVLMLYSKEGLVLEQNVAPLILLHSEMFLCPPSMRSKLNNENMLIYWSTKHKLVVCEHTSPHGEVAFEQFQYAPEGIIAIMWRSQ